MSMRTSKSEAKTWSRVGLISHSPGSDSSKSSAALPCGERCAWQRSTGAHGVNVLRVLVHVAMPQATKSVRRPRSSKFSSARARMARPRRAAGARSSDPKASEKRTVCPARSCSRATSLAPGQVQGPGLEVAVAEQGVATGDVDQLARPVLDGPADPPAQGLVEGAVLWPCVDVHRLSPLVGFLGDRPA